MPKIADATEKMFQHYKGDCADDRSAEPRDSRPEL